MPSIIALIPARAGSKRVPNKNIRELAGHPLLAYTIAAARESGVFSWIAVSSDSKTYLILASEYGGHEILRPPEFAMDSSPDIEWITHALAQFRRFDAFSILRPTSPFRSAETIRRAWAEFQNYELGCDSLRAVERCRQHPGKMWRRTDGGLISPYWMRHDAQGHPYHSKPTQTLPEVLVQNASLEIAWVQTVKRTQSIAGYRVLPFFTEGWEGFDINTEQDWWLAEHLIATGQAKLPEIGYHQYI